MAGLGEKGLNFKLQYNKQQAILKHDKSMKKYTVYTVHVLCFYHGTILKLTPPHQLHPYSYHICYLRYRTSLFAAIQRNKKEPVRTQVSVRKIQTIQYQPLF